MRRMLVPFLVALVLSGVNAGAGGTEEAATTTTTTMGDSKYNESPMLAAQVASGDLPPVDERLPIEPLVLTPPEIGKYGGTATTFAFASWAVEIGGWWHSTWTLEVDKDTFQVAGGMAKGYELSDDAKTFTLFLREGMKWSDGHPLTAEDFLYRYEESLAGRQGYRLEPIDSIVAPDDYTLRINLSKPFPRIVINMANQNGADWFRWLPKHYLIKWHADYTEDAQSIAKEEGFETWEQALAFHRATNNFNDPELPSLRMFVPREIGDVNRLYERNPYWYAVDPANNQLPYIDRVQSLQVDFETYKLKVLNGEATIAQWTRFPNFTLFKENEAAADYTVVLIPGTVGSQHTYHVNQTQSDPVIREVFQDIRFRHALSLAIDREEINETVYLGMGVPRAGTLVPSVSYYKSEWGEDHPYARYDPAEANRLLDEMGLTDRDRDGFRSYPDGRTINLSVVQNGGKLPDEGHELVKDYWEEIGIKFTLRNVEGGFYWDFTLSNEYMITTRPLTNAMEMAADRGIVEGSFATPLSGPSWAPAWAHHLKAELAIEEGRATLADYEGGVLPGEEPPPRVRELWDAILEAHNSIFGTEEYRRANQKVQDIFAEEMWVIGTVGLVPSPIIYKNNIGNRMSADFLYHDWPGELDWALYFTDL